jgi:electron transport complex protein RnfC
MNKIKKFPIGGTHLPEEKGLTNHIPIQDIPWPSKVTIPLKQHTGVPVQPLVKVGDAILPGTLLGKDAQGLHARVHSGVGGTVTAITQAKLPDGSLIDGVEITCDTDPGPKKEQCFEPLDLQQLDQPNYAQQVIARVEEAGIVGLGGATFPTHIKLSGKDPIDTVIINGAECEPYITVDDRLMQESAELLFRGLEIIRKTFGANHGYVACEINKPKALERLREVAKQYDHLDAVALDTRYPHGAEKHLIKAVLDREVPLRALPSAVGVVVNNVQTAIAVAEAVDHGRALHSRVVTVSGHGINDPRNLRIPTGISIQHAIDVCGGIKSDNVAVIVGGPMTGLHIHDLDTVVTKGTSGIVVLTEQEFVGSQPMACIRCGKCVEVCPMYLPPNRITSYVNNDMLEESIEAGLMACIMCGACQFVCPSKRPLLEWIKQGKAQAAAKERVTAK